MNFKLFDNNNYVFTQLSIKFSIIIKNKYHKLIINLHQAAQHICPFVWQVKTQHTK